MAGLDAARFYGLLPTPLQHLATAGYGLRLERVRRRGAYAATRQRLAATERLDAAELAGLQAGELQRTLRQALGAPYWRELFARLGLAPESIRTPDDLRRLPRLDKRTVLARSADLRAPTASRVRTYYTSGTSGTTLAVPIDDVSRQRNYAFFARALSWAGVEHGRSATFAGRTLVPSREAHPRSVWRWNPAMRNRLFSSYHLSPANAPAYSRALCAWAPDYVDSYPSAVSTLAALLRSQRLPAPKLRAVVTSSETLLASQREAIAEVFGAPCFDQYGCTEQSAYVSQCEAGTYHVHPEYGIVEIVDAAGDPVAPGESGELLCTSFTNDAFPLLRYGMGDVATLGEPGCACGRAFPVVLGIEGRMDDLLVTPDGRRIGRLDPVFKGRRTIAEAQIVQESALDVRVCLVPGEGYVDDDGASVVRELQARLSPEMRIRVERVAAIERTRSGKLRPVVNRYSPGAGGAECERGRAS
jgi:phenylacetate-CoA ligase